MLGHLVDALIWIAAGIALLFVEVFSPRQYYWSIGMGALFAGASQRVGLESLPLQGLVFLAVSATLLVLTRTGADTYFQNVSPHLRMNADALPGQVAVALTELALGSSAGRVRLRAMEWLAQPVDDRVIPIGARVRVVAVNGITLVVRAEEG